MKIYTKGGDAGQTGLFGGARVPKDDLRIRTYGTLDELNAALGIALAELSGKECQELAARLLRIQGELFQLGAELATPKDKSAGMRLVEEPDVIALEREIDAMEASLQPLKSFILPGGSKGSALLHFSRTVCRRAERELVVLHRASPVRGEVLRYVNRLSDYLFVCARFANCQSGVPDVTWLAPKP